MKDNKMLAAVLIIVIVLAVAFIVWKVMAGKRAPAGAEGGKGGAAPVELKPGTMPPPPPPPGKAAPAGGG